jgi:hypothetical protein
MLMDYLRVHGQKVSRQSARDSLMLKVANCDVDDVLKGITCVFLHIMWMCDLLRLHMCRTVYSVLGPHYLWHIDGNHKLNKRFALVIHAVIDGCIL